MSKQSNTLATVSAPAESLPPEMSQNVADCRNAPVDLRDGPRYFINGKELSERQKSAAVLLLRGMSDSDVARQIGVDRMTIARWRRTPSFRHVLDVQRHLIWQRSVSRLHSLIEPSIGVLEKQLDSSDSKTAMRAAAILLRLAGPARIPRVAIDGGEESHMAELKQQERAMCEEIEAYLHAPVPGEPGAP